MSKAYKGKENVKQDRQEQPAIKDKDIDMKGAKNMKTANQSWVADKKQTNSSVKASIK